MKTSTRRSKDSPEFVRHLERERGAGVRQQEVPGLGQRKRSWLFLCCLFNRKTPAAPQPTRERFSCYSCPNVCISGWEKRDTLPYPLALVPSSFFSYGPTHLAGLFSSSALLQAEDNQATQDNSSAWRERRVRCMQT